MVSGNIKGVIFLKTEVRKHPKHIEQKSVGVEKAYEKDTPRKPVKHLPGGQLQTTLQADFIGKIVVAVELQRWWLSKEIRSCPYV